MIKITENVKIIPWLLNSNLDKMNEIVSYIGPTALKLSKKKFRKSMEEKSKALLSRAQKEVRSYTKVAKVYKVYPELTKLGTKLEKISEKLQRSYKLVKRLLIRECHPTNKAMMMLRLTKTSLVVRKSRAERILLKLEIMVDVMVDYIEQFRFLVKGVAKGIQKTLKKNSVHCRYPESRKKTDFDT